MPFGIVGLRDGKLRDRVRTSRRSARTTRVVRSLSRCRDEAEKAALLSLGVCVYASDKQIDRQEN